MTIRCWKHKEMINILLMNISSIQVCPLKIFYRIFKKLTPTTRIQVYPSDVHALGYGWWKTWNICIHIQYKHIYIYIPWNDINFSLPTLSESPGDIMLCQTHSSCPSSAWKYNEWQIPELTIGGFSSKPCLITRG